MTKIRSEPEVFLHIDELVEQFLKHSDNLRARADLRHMMVEAELLVACIDRLDEWIQVMEHRAGELVLPDVWLRNREDQIRELYRGCDDLIEVATEILPARVVSLVLPHLH